MRTLSRHIVGLLFCIVFAGNLDADIKSISASSNEIRAISLLQKFYAKLESNTYFTLDDENMFFGQVPNMWLPTVIYWQLGYIDAQGKIIKPLPKYSIFGELLRLNRDLFLSKGAKGIGFFCSNEYFANKDNKLQEVTSNYVTIFAKMDNMMNEIAYKDEKLVSIRYNSISGILIPPITVDGKSILEKLGFSYDNKSNSISLNKETVKLLVKQLREIESQ